MSTYLIAEIGNTHEGSLGLAKQFILAAAETGVDCVKFQTHIFEAESLEDAPNPPYFKDETRKDYFERTSFTKEEYFVLKGYANELGCDFISSPFSLEAVNLLEEVGIPFYKVPSGEVNNLPLLERIGKTRKKVLLSSGMSSWDELEQAISTLSIGGCPEVVLLQCTSKYPCPPQDAGLNLLAELSERFNVAVGFSDHTSGNAIAIAAVTLGASIVEKHFTLSKKMYGSDARFAAEPDEFRSLVDSVRAVDLALKSKVDKSEMQVELINMKKTFEKSVVAARELFPGDIITFADLSFKKPGVGIPANQYKELLGKRLVKPVAKNKRLELSDFN